MNRNDYPEKREKEDKMPKPDIIVRGGILISMREGEEPVKNASVLIKGDRIINIASANEISSEIEDAEIIEAGKGIILPGLVNAHVHTAMTLFRGLADDLPLKQWLFEKIFPAESTYLNPETVYWGTLLGCLEMIASGTTTIADSYFYQGDTLRAVHRSGLRGLIAQGIIDFPAPGVGNPEENLKKGKDFIEKWIEFSDLITPGLFCHSPLTCSEQTLTGTLEICNKFDLPLQTHLSETFEEVTEIFKKTGKRPLNFLNSIGLLNGHFIAAHAIHLDDEELALLGEKDVKVVTVPESNMKLASGVARVPDMLNMGLKIGIGTDGCASNNNLDIFEEMDTVAKLHKVSSMDPVALSAKTALKMATVGGAAALGLEKVIGTIEVGKKADIIVLDLERPHLTPIYNPFSAIVYSANGGDVKDVIVNGRILMKERAFRTLDAEEIMARVAEISMKIKG